MKIEGLCLFTLLVSFLTLSAWSDQQRSNNQANFVRSANNNQNVQGGTLIEEGFNLRRGNLPEEHNAQSVAYQRRVQEIRRVDLEQRQQQTNAAYGVQNTVGERPASAMDTEEN